MDVPCFYFQLIVILSAWEKRVPVRNLGPESLSQTSPCSVLCSCQVRNLQHQDSPVSPPRVSLSGAYVCKGRSGWLMPLGEALWENADLQLCVPMKFKRAPPLPPPPGPAMCTLLLDMLASDPDARPPADQLEARVRSALKEDSHWQRVCLRDRNDYNH